MKWVLDSVFVQDKLVAGRVVIDLVDSIRVVKNNAQSIAMAGAYAVDPVA
jgi:hypothetical protein